MDILGCTGMVAERAATLHKIIRLAVELWRSVGDLFALSAVMKGLQLPQVSTTVGRGMNCWVYTKVRMGFDDGWSLPDLSTK